MQLIDGQTGNVLLMNISVAKTFFQRLSGLMFKRNLGKSFGLWIEPCGSIHTFWMLISIDVYFIDSRGVILECRRNVAPWRVVISKQKSHAVLEIPHGGEIPEVGTQLQIRP